MSTKIIYDQKSESFRRDAILDPRAKGVFLLFIVVGVLYSINQYFIVSLAYIALLLAILSKIKFKHLFISILFISLFSLIASLIASYTGIMENPYTFFLIFETRFLTIYFISAWYFVTVEPYELAVSLEKMFIPAILVWFIIIIYQFIPVVTKEAREINDIKRLKGLNAKRWQIYKQANIMRKTLKPLISGAINRGVDLAESMVMKGFEPKRRKSYALSVKIRSLDVVMIISSTIALVLAIIYLKT